MRVWYKSGTFVWALISVLSVSAGYAKEITLQEALDIAVNCTARGSMIRGNQEVGEQNYYARRINFYLPEISINGSVPSLDFSKNYDTYGQQKGLFERRTIDYTSFIELKQSLITGGDFSIKGNLLKQNQKYPDFRSPFSSDSLNTDLTKRGFFEFDFTQPILKPSQGKYDLHTSQDDMELARIARVEDETTLRKEVATAFIETIKLSGLAEISSNKLEKTTLQVEIDSAKLGDGVISEETFLTSVASKLDAELSSFEVKTQTEESKRELAILLDADVTQDIVAIEPLAVDTVASSTKKNLMSNWEQSLAIKRAEHVYNKAKRSADFAAGGHGLTGDLSVNYSFGRGTVETERIDAMFSEDIKTNGWGLRLNFRYPVWDGGSGAAAVKASRYQAEQARLEFERAKKTARASLINLLNSLDVSFRRLEILRKQVELAKNRLDIAEGRMNDGQISKITYLDARIFWLETRDKYLQELTTYLTNKISLEGAFAS